MKFLRLLFTLLFLTGFPQAASGHQVETVEFEFQRLKNEWCLSGEMDIAYMLPETRKIPGGQPLSRVALMKAPPEELARIRRETENTLRNLLRISFAGREFPWKIEFPDFEKDPFTLPEEAADWALLSARIVMPAQSGPGELKVQWSGEEESELIILIESGKTAGNDENDEIVSVPPGGEISLLKVEGSGRAGPVGQSGLASWIGSGFRHVVPLGLDHMLFIVGLFLMVPKWKPLLKQSLMFTIAHSVTLALAVLGLVSLPSKLVEVLIAFSIAFIGIENLFSSKVGKLRLYLVLGFGLIHGMGFASVLADKLNNIPPDRLGKPLLGFNIGVELAQISVFGISFLILWPLKKWDLQVRTAGSVFVALAGIGWMIERIFFS